MKFNISKKFFLMTKKKKKIKNAIFYDIEFNKEKVQFENIFHPLSDECQLVGSVV